MIDPFLFSLLQLSHRHSHAGIFIIVGNTRQLDGIQPFEARIITPETAKTFSGSGIPPPDLELKVCAARTAKCPALQHGTSHV